MCEGILMLLSTPVQEVPIWSSAIDDSSVSLLILESVMHALTVATLLFMLY